MYDISKVCSSGSVSINQVPLLSPFPFKHTLPCHTRNDHYITNPIKPKPCLSLLCDGQMTSSFLRCSTQGEDWPLQTRQAKIAQTTLDPSTVSMNVVILTRSKSPWLAVVTSDKPWAARTTSLIFLKTYCPLHSHHVCIYKTETPHAFKHLFRF